MIPYADTKVVYAGDGETTVFPFTFKYAEATDVKVSLYEIATDTTTVLTKDYYVDTTAGTVIYPGYAPGQEAAESERPAPLDSAHRIVIYRETEISQPVDLGEKYPLTILENMHDRAVMLLQELNEIMDRTVKISAGSDKTPDEIISSISANAKLAADSASEAAKYEDAAKGYVAKAAERVDEIAGYAQDAEASKNQTIGYAALVMGRTASVWSADKAYNAQDAVVYTDGYVYQCVEYSPAGTKPDSSNLWVKVKIALDDFFYTDDDGFLVPSETPTFSNWLTMDEDGFITIKEA